MAGEAVNGHGYCICPECLGDDDSLKPTPHEEEPDVKNKTERDFQHIIEDKEEVLRRYEIRKFWLLASIFAGVATWISVGLAFPVLSTVLVVLAVIVGLVLIAPAVICFGITVYDAHQTTTENYTQVSCHPAAQLKRATREYHDWLADRNTGVDADKE